MPIAQGTVGEALTSDGVSPIGGLRQGRQNDTIISNLHGRYYEQSSRNRIFHLPLTATTTGAAAGNLVGAAAAASTQFALWNPTGNKFNLSLLKVYVGVISGTPPGGPLFHGEMLQGVPSINSSGTAFSAYTGGNNPTARFVASAAGAALTGGGAITTIRPMAIDFSAVAFAAAAGANALENVEGDIVIAPGFGWVPLWATAGNTLLNAYGVSWEEVPIPS
jgi:hypothetical protein